jgi:hypothetical protein
MYEDARQSAVAGEWTFGAKPALYADSGRPTGGRPFIKTFRRDLVNKYRKFAAALTVAGFVATGMFASSARLHAAGPGGGKSQGVLCGLLESAISAATALGNQALIDYLTAQYAANCTAL